VEPCCGTWICLSIVHFATVPGLGGLAPVPTPPAPNPTPAGYPPPATR